jgi:hypothetical protein
MREEGEEFEECKKKLGLEYPVHELLAKSGANNSKESVSMVIHKEVNERNKNIGAVNVELKKKLSATKKQQEDSTKSLKDFREKCDRQLKQLEELFKEL